MAAGAADARAPWDWDELPGSRGAFTPGHRAFQATCRAFVEAELVPNVPDWEEEGGFPKELHERAYAAGMNGAFWPKQYGGTTPTAEEADMFHYFIFYDELARACASGLYGSLFTHSIGLPPILSLGTEAQKDKFARSIIAGKKNVCLAVTEPGGGSDVANVRTTATLDPTGEFYVVSGQKTFISGGMNADVFTAGVRTANTGLKGVSLLMIEKPSPGLKTTRLKTQGWHLSTTTLVTFDDVKVPVANRLGAEGEGFKAIMQNFNNERLAIAITANRQGRVCLEDAVKYARARKTFGKALIEHQVIRHKLMECSRHLMATYGPIALCKVQATKSMEFVVRECSQVFGGKSYLRSGAGQNVERAYREVRVCAIGGGSEEVMLDLASRQAKL